MAKKVKIKKTLVEQILTKAGIDHTGIQINALAGLSIVNYVLVAFFFALGIWLGIWMSQLEDKYK